MNQILQGYLGSYKQDVNQSVFDLVISTKSLTWEFTSASGKSWWTAAIKSINSVGAGSVVYARIAYTFVFVCYNNWSTNNEANGENDSSRLTKRP